MPGVGLVTGWSLSFTFLYVGAVPGSRKLPHLIRSGSLQKTGGCLTLGSLKSLVRGLQDKAWDKHGIVQHIRARKSRGLSSVRPAEGEERAFHRIQRGRPA